MNVYDFDGTIYDGDSTRDFIVFCAAHYPAVIARFPGAIAALCAYALGRLSRDEAKGRCLHVLAAVPDLTRAVSKFWDRSMPKVMRWYIDQRESDDLVISASPDFLVDEACRRLEIRGPIATLVDVHTMGMLTPNCRGEEKVRRLSAELPDARIEAFYSDSVSDEPIARIAQRAYLVCRGKISPWHLEENAS